MPKLLKTLPKYRHHSTRDCAFVVISGQRVYLPGPYGSDESKAEYRRLCAEWIVQDRPSTPTPPINQLTIVELMLRFWRHCERHYVKNGEPTDEQSGIRLALRPLRELYGTTRAAEFGPLKLKTVREQMIPFMPRIVGDMARLQLLCGARPGEIVILRPCDLKRDGKVWKYTPESHKNQHRGKSRVIYFGPQAQQILRPYLERRPDAYCFSPAEAETERRQAAHEARKTPLTYGNSPGKNLRRAPRKTPAPRSATPTPTPRSSTPNAPNASRWKSQKKWDDATGGLRAHYARHGREE